MPQLDLYSIASQFFFGISFFCVFYYVVVFYVIPAIFTILYARNYYTGGSTEINSFVISYVFISQALVINAYSDVLELSFSSVDINVQCSSVVTNFVLLDVFNLEFSEAFEEADYEDESDENLFFIIS